MWCSQKMDSSFGAGQYCVAVSCAWGAAIHKSLSHSIKYQTHSTNAKTVQLNYQEALTKLNILTHLGKGAKIKKYKKVVPGPLRPWPPSPQHNVVLLLCFVHNFIENPSSEVVPLIIFADPPPPKWSPDHFFYFCTLPLLKWVSCT